MPLLTAQIGSNGPIITAMIGISVPRQIAMQQAGQKAPPLLTIPALIDTGASCSAVDPLVVKSLGLVQTGSVLVHTPSTGPVPADCKQYDVALVIPMGAGGMHMVSATIPVIEAHLIAQGIQALLGRDVLSQACFMYHGTIGWMSLAF